LLLRGRDSNPLWELMGLPGKPFPALPRSISFFPSLPRNYIRSVHELSKPPNGAIIQIMSASKRRSARRPILDLRNDYLLFAERSAGTPAFRKLFYRIDGKTIDVLRDGDLSCAFFVSGVLAMFGLIDAIHTTVKATRENLKRRGWKPVAKPVRGAVIVWAPKKFRTSGETHRHIGFALGNGKAVSNSSKRRSPRVHAWDFRPVEEILYKDLG